MRLPERLSPRLPVILFVILAVLTVGAFSITQHLKVGNPLYNGDPRVDPPVINPRAGGVCADESGKAVSYRMTRLGFYLQSKSDYAYVDVFNADGYMVAQMRGSGRFVTARLNNYVFFSWNGRTSSGAYAPAGVYTVRLYLKRQDRDLPITGQTITVDYRRPMPRITGVSVEAATGTTTTGTTTTGTTTTTATTATTATGTVSVAPSSGGASPVSTAGPAFTPGPQSVTIHFHPDEYRGADVLVYRAAADGTLSLVKTYGIDPDQGSAEWDGMINDRPAPAGTYLLGLSAFNAACTRGQYPQVSDPAPNSTDGEGINVSYLTATPPLDPVTAGGLAGVGVQSGGAPYSWRLQQAGQAKVIFRGVSSSANLAVRLPAVGLYELTLNSAGRQTAVPLVASAVGARAAAPVLVVLPALSWQGANATTSGSDGLIDTLANGATVDLQRPLVAGLPADVANEAALLGFLDSEHLDYDLTTDVALAQGVGPELKGRTGVLLDGTFAWLPSEIDNPLRGFVAAGGSVFAAGLNSLQNAAPITGSGPGAAAGPAYALASDPFGVRHAAVSPSDGELITELTDGLGIFSSTAALQFPRYQVLAPPGGQVASAAGVSEAAPTVIGFHLAKGTVVEAGLPDFGLSLTSDVDSRELLSRVWQVVLSR